MERDEIDDILIIFDDEYGMIFFHWPQF
jgi:hypothetical protein